MYGLLLNRFRSDIYGWSNWKVVQDRVPVVASSVIHSLVLPKVPTPDGSLSLPGFVGPNGQGCG